MTPQLREISGAACSTYNCVEIESYLSGKTQKRLIGNLSINTNINKCNQASLTIPSNTMPVNAKMQIQIEIVFLLISHSNNPHKPKKRTFSISQLAFILEQFIDLFHLYFHWLSKLELFLQLGQPLSIFFDLRPLSCLTLGLSRPIYLFIKSLVSLTLGYFLFQI